MSLQFVYVLVSDEGDPYEEMACTSIRLLRALHRDANVKVIVDPRTAESLRKRASRLLDWADVIVHKTGRHKLATYRSRFLKTSMRQIVDGDFLYLDVDTLPIRPLEDIFVSDGRLAAALDRNAQNPEPHCPTWIRHVFAPLAWRYPVRQYFNSGVILFPDTPAARAVGKEWHRRWRTTAAMGIHYDQPAFNSTLDALAASLRELPLRFNAMISADVGFAADAAIVHLFASCHPPCQRAVDDFLAAIAGPGDTDWRHCRDLLLSAPAMAKRAEDTKSDAGNPLATRLSAWVARFHSMRAIRGERCLQLVRSLRKPKTTLSLAREE